MNLRTTDAQDTKRELAWLDGLRAATTTLREERSELDRHLALRMNMRGERAMTTAGVSWI